MVAVAVVGLVTAVWYVLSTFKSRYYTCTLIICFQYAPSDSDFGGVAEADPPRSHEATPDTTPETASLASSIARPREAPPSPSTLGVKRLSCFCKVRPEERTT